MKEGTTAAAGGRVRRSLEARVAIGSKRRALVAWAAVLCLGGGATGGSFAALEPDSGPSPASLPLDDATVESGLDFVHFNGMSGRMYYSEIMGSGVALLDYDEDGDLDLFLSQGRPLGPGVGLEDALVPPAPDMLPLRGRLYRNDGWLDAGGRPRMTLVDVTTASRLEATGYGMGVATGDVDNDGHVDLLLTNAGPDQLWRNLGDGTFAPSPAALPADDRWSLSASFLDFDRDGWLDLYVTHYVDFEVAEHRPCRAMTGARDYCGPQAYEPVSDQLLRNRGDGTFEDVSASSGIGRVAAPGMGVVAADFDDDGWPDLYVANDAAPNFLWMNRRDGTFEDRALLAGCAVNGRGQPEAGMGIALGDYDDDGDPDLLVTHLREETNTLYAHDGRGGFEDRSAASGLGPPSFASTAFGTSWIDLDNDGRLDLATVAGGVAVLPSLAAAGDPYPLHMTNQLFRQRDDRGFVEVTSEAGPVFAVSEVSRGLAAGDLDNDGDTDLVLSNNSGPARLLLSVGSQSGRWVGLHLRSRPPGLDPGIRVDVSDEQVTRRRWLRTDGSYLSASDPRALVGLGPSPGAVRGRVRGPSGTAIEMPLPVDRYLVLTHGPEPTGGTQP